MWIAVMISKKEADVDIGLGNVRLESDLDAKPGYDGN